MTDSKPQWKAGDRVAVFGVLGPKNVAGVWPVYYRELPKEGHKIKAFWVRTEDLHRAPSPSLSAGDLEVIREGFAGAVAVYQGKSLPNRDDTDKIIAALAILNRLGGE